jgi:hypothetical protein
MRGLESIVPAFLFHHVEPIGWHRYTRSVYVRDECPICHRGNHVCRRPHFRGVAAIAHDASCRVLLKSCIVFKQRKPRIHVLVDFGIRCTPCNAAGAVKGLNCFAFASEMSIAIDLFLAF